MTSPPTHLAPLLAPRHHHDHVTALLPHHAPEVGGGLAGRALGGDVGVLLAVAAHVVGVDVVRARHALYRRERETRVVVGDDVGVAVLGLVALHARVLPLELLARVDRLPTRLSFRTQIFPMYCSLWSSKAPPFDLYLYEFSCS